MKQYLALLEDVLTNGAGREDRTGTGTIGVFGRQSRYDLRDGFPCLTTKKLHLRSIIYELLCQIRWALTGGFGGANGSERTPHTQRYGAHSYFLWHVWAESAPFF